MSINAYLDVCICITDPAYNEQAETWASKVYPQAEIWTSTAFPKAPGKTAGSYLQISTVYDCSYANNAFEEFIGKIADSELPPTVWEAQLTWSAEEGATENGNTLIVDIIDGEVSRWQESRIVFDDAEPWEEMVEYCNKLQTETATPDNQIATEHSPDYIPVSKTRKANIMRELFRFGYIVSDNSDQLEHDADYDIYGHFECTVFPIRYDFSSMLNTFTPEDESKRFNQYRFSKADFSYDKPLDQTVRAI